ncbi:MAG TPA: response regulator [Opitutaceae bacterium]|nr:response regulator [Opitutaceae bacterium]
MAARLQLPHAPWLQRISIALAVALCVVGACILAGGSVHSGAAPQLATGIQSMKANAALAMFLLGAVLLALELGHALAAWLALLPALIGLLTLVEYGFHFNAGIDELFMHDQPFVDITAPGRMHPMMAACALLAGAVLVWRAAAPRSSGRILAQACGGSTIVSVGFSSLLGWAASLPAVYHWGSVLSISPVSASAMLLLGLALLTMAWRENENLTGEPPAWMPLPVVVFSAMLTLIFWAGLREREILYLGTDTQIAINNLAGAITHELDRQIDAFERMAHRWSDTAEDATTVWETDAITQLSANGSPGCLAIERVNELLRTRWVYPAQGNEGDIDFDHGSDPVRLAAIDTARLTAGPVISGTVRLPTRGPGFVLYAPVYHGGKFAGFAAGEFLYQSFFNSITRGLNLPSDYHCTIEIAGQRVYNINAAGTGGDDLLTLDQVFSIADRRVRITLTPLPQFLQQNRRYLPELALATGLGITFLLGLTVHLARSARSGQRAAESSNRKLLAENEERRRVEAMLTVSDERLRLALDSTYIGIFEWQFSTRKFYYSPSVWTMLGYDQAKKPLSPEIWMSLVHPDDLPAFREVWERQRRGQAPFIDPEYRVRTADGAWRWVYMRSRGLTPGDASGTPTRIISTIQDITARKEAEQALRKSQAATRKLSLVAARTDNLVLIGSPDGRIEWVNESFSRMMEYSLAEVVGKDPVKFLLGPEADLRTIRRIRAGMIRSKGFSTDVVGYSKSGRKYNLSLEIQPVFNETGQLENFIAIAADVTARVETEANLRRAKAEADAASRAKSEFLASMSHEIRTPMNGVIGMTSLLMETPLSPEQRDYVQTVRSSGEALLTIINDILDFSKIESGKMELESMPFELAGTIEEALDLFAVQAAAKKLELSYVIDPAVPAWISGDVTRLRQVLVNLVNNAVKFTPSGVISISIRRHLDSPMLALAGNSGSPFPAPLKLDFTVRDTGIGIPADRLSRLFQPFSQVDSSTTRKYGGTGLGLVICQRLCALMGGDIRVASTVGKGSAFTFTIMTEAVQMDVDAPKTALPATLKSAPVLVLEDEPVNLARLKNFFGGCGVACLACSDPAEAEEQLARAPSVSAVVIDAELLNTAAAQALREHLIALNLPLLLLLGPGQPPAKNGAGKTDTQVRINIAKPLKTSSLVRGLHQIFRFDADASAVADLRPLADDIPLEILIVEDNTVNQKVALRLLERLGYRADTVANGIEALNVLSTRHYQLVLMDVQMPEMDGFEATRTIRTRLAPERQPKIVAVTANALKGDRELCLNAGMNDYITKPIKLDEIRDAIRRQFPLAPKSDGTGEID